MSGAAPRGLRCRLRRFGWHHPEWWVVAAAAVAWAFLAGAGHEHAGHPGMGGGHGQGALGIAVMVVAMMLPLTLGNVRHVAFSSLWRRRHRAILAFLAGYLAVWIIVQAAIVEGWGWLAPLVGWKTAGVVAMIAAVIWELAPIRQRWLRRCHHTVPLAPRGWRADADCARYGVTTGMRCAAMCWALMVACVAFAHSLAVMAVLFGVQLLGRYHRRPSPALAAAAVLGGCLLPSAAGFFSTPRNPQGINRAILLLDLYPIQRPGPGRMGPEAVSRRLYRRPLVAS